MELKFSGQRVLILGGSCELALTLAELLIKEGLFPVVTWRSQKGEIRVKERLQPFSGEYGLERLDMGSRTSIASLYAAIGHDLDYLVDFAHGELEGLIGAANSDNVRCYFSENVSFRAEILKKAARIMLRNHRGRLIFISSTAACRPNSGQGFYAASKLACEALYRSLGLELGSRGITTLSLRPGFVDAGRGRAYLDRNSEEILRGVPIRRALSCREVAETILFFLSDSATGFNATEINMDGGMTSGKKCL